MRMMTTRTSTRMRRTTTRTSWSIWLLAVVVTFGQQQAGVGYAVVAGTVFNDRGFVVRGATVSLTPQGASKLKKQQAVTDARGEFAFRVPPVQGNWVARASIKGFMAAEKTVEVTGEERKDVTLELVAESK